MAHFAFVTELYWPHIGGQEVRYRELASRLVERGHTIEILTISTDVSLPRVENIEGITVRRLVVSPSYKSRKFKRNPLTILRFSFLVAARLLNHEYDYIVFNQWPILPQILMGRLTRGKTLMDWCEHRSGRLYHVLFQLCVWSTPTHICVSSSLARLLRGRYGLKDPMIVPSGIEWSSYTANQHKSGLLFIGRLAPHKHPEMLVAAMELLTAEGYKMPLTIAGDGPMLNDIRRLTQNGNNIRVLGRISESQKRSLLASSWLHVLPSEREGFPRTIAEAMASGTPTLTVSSPDNGGKAIVDEYKCGIVAKATAPALARSILELANHSDRWDELSIEGLKQSEQLDWGPITERFIKFLKADSSVAGPSDARR